MSKDIIVANLAIINMEFNRRDFLKTAAVIAGSAALAACDTSNETSIIPTVPFDVDVHKLNPERNIFLSNNIFGRLEAIGKVKQEDLLPYQAKITEAVKRVGEDLLWDIPKMSIVADGLLYTDQTGLERKLIFVIATPKIENAQPSLFLYSEFDFEKNAFVPLEEASNNTEGRLFMVTPNSVNNDTETLFGLANWDKLEITVPLFYVTSNADGTKDVLCIEPFSGSSKEITNIDVDSSPDFFGKMLSLVPETISEEFKKLQEKIAESENYTLNQNGEIEMQAEEGTIIVNGIKVSKTDGTATLTHDEQEFIIDTNTFKFEGNTFSFKDENGRIWVWDENRLLRSYFEEELAQMNPEEKLKIAPETIGNLEKSNLSTVPSKDYLVLYRDEEGNAVKVFNLLTAQELSLSEAGIIEFNMKDGTKLEMAYFEEIQEAIDYVYFQRGARESTKEMFLHPKEYEIHSERIGGILNFPKDANVNIIGGREILFDKNDRSNIAFGVMLSSAYQDTLVVYYNSILNQYEVIYINQSANTTADLIGKGTITISVVEN